MRGLAVCPDAIDCDVEVGVISITMLNGDSLVCVQIQCLERRTGICLHFSSAWCLAGAVTEADVHDGLLCPGTERRCEAHFLGDVCSAYCG